MPTGVPSWLVLRHEDASEILLTQTDRLSSDTMAPGYPEMRPGKPVGTGATQLVRMDPPLHTRYRKMFAPFFSAKRINAWKPELDQIVSDAIDDLLNSGSPADFYDKVALVVPSKAICMLLGADYSLHEDFERMTRATASSVITAAERNAAVQDMKDLLAALIDEKRVTSEDGVIMKLINLLEADEIPHDR